jgi:hypothetical protein
VQNDVLMLLQRRNRGDDNHYLETLNEFHGDYDMDWIVMKLRDGSPSGKEVERYNCRFIVGIVWI